MPDLRAAFYGDDFTGSVDALLQFARAGWRGRLFVGVPTDSALETAAEESDVIGIAGIARSLPTAQLEAEVLPALRALASLGPRILQYKACSTADSSPELGSLGRIVEIGREVVGPRTVPMLFAQPDFGRYTVFGHHFAAEGGVIHRLDRQPTMAQHPSTPMTESDLAVHVSRQTDLPVGSISHLAYASSEALAERIDEDAAAAVVLDALDDRHLALIGAALALMPGTVFAIGSGGLSTAIGRASGRPGEPLAAQPIAGGPVLAVSGSRSPRTSAQVAAAARAGWLVRPLDVDPHAPLDDVIGALRAGTSVALTSDEVDPARRGTAASALAQIATAATAAVGDAVHARATRRVIVCGGDTSSRVTRMLGVESLSIAANPWGNVVLCTAHAPGAPIDGAQLLLKGGQVGDDDLFERVRLLGG